MSRTLSIASLILAVAAAAATTAHAQQEAMRGTAFFLLSDASYGPKDTAMVRLEATDMGVVGEYGGADVYVYKVKDPLRFLQSQKNLHRIDVRGDYAGPGMGNALSRVWDNWWNDSRAAWRKLFSQDARQAVIAQAPDVAQRPLAGQPTPQQLNPQYRPLAGHELVDSFRYPVQVARIIEPPKGVKLLGSSSEFLAAPQGNVMIPIGKRAPGLYLVEAMVGAHRATTLVFVSDSIAVTKVSSKQMLVWVASRGDGKPVAGAKTVWTDGVGVLKSGATDLHGLTVFERDAPEKTYVFGEDAAGGVFIAENYYYDSEIYNAKIYAVTDRPLYRPGDQVFVKFMGREFRSARQSVPIAAGDVKLQVLDPNGFPVASQSFRIAPETGADTSFVLPENASAGGYELRFNYQGDAYGAAFRVAEYQKPHFEISVLPGQRDYKTGQEVTGRLQLTYPDGKPVAGASAELQVRAQRLTMIEGDLGYSGQFPVKLSTTSLTTDSKGIAEFKLPAAAEPSRYVLTALATDGAAYRVRVTKEILIERSAGTFSVKSERAFSAPGDTISFSLRALGGSSAAPPASWDWVRLEDRSRANGKLTANDKFEIQFSQPGTYTISLRDAAGNIVGASSHHVSGGAIGAPRGSIEIVLDKTQYKPGDTASALITFPQKIEYALFTLERDKVEKTALMTSAERWVRAERVTPTQWRAELPIGADYGPNITFSVLYVKDGEYVFQNRGLKVEQPRIEVAVQADKAVYAPGDTVSLDLTALIGDKAAAGAQLTVSVVDEMIYVLQPEIAPDVFDFFYHPRRNNVRTSASLNFIGYDLAKPPAGAGAPSRRDTHERAIKVLERPRREDKDTALWQPTVAADAAGHARVSFTMPDSLTRWRVTVRAADKAGTVGQSIAYVRSDKDFYVKWTSPNWMRSQDAPNASVAIFNQGTSEAGVELSAAGAGVKQTQKLKLKPGANFVSLPLKPGGGDNRIDLKLASGGKTVDALTVPLKILPVHWQSPHSESLRLNDAETPLKLPADAANLRVQLADSAAAQFRRVLDDLIEYPYGCVEQTASRLLPNSIALQSLPPGNDALNSRLTQQVHTQRFRLAQYAGPQATFGWWSPPANEKDADALLTAYAYYADWHATRALGLTMPPGHWDRLLEVYRKQGSARSPWHRALILYWMQDMGLPAGSMAEALAQELGGGSAKTAANATNRASPLASAVLTQEEAPLTNDMTRLLAAYVVQQAKGKLTPEFVSSLDPAAERLRAAHSPLSDALLMLEGKLPADQAATVLDGVRAEMPTIDRSLTMLWVQRALGGGNNPNNPLRAAITQAALAAPWQAEQSATGQRLFRWPASNPAPKTIKLEGASMPGMFAIVQYDSREPETSSLPVTLQRKLYRLKKIDSTAPKAATTPQRGAGMPELAGETSNFELELMAPDAALKTDEVYLDEVVLSSTVGAPLRFGILEVPLPPGASADRTTWGIAVRYPGKDAGEALERARFEATPTGYAVPLDSFSGQVTIRHLVRVAQTGTFAMPPARYYRMYQPDQKAFEEKSRARLEIR